MKKESAEFTQNELAKIGEDNLNHVWSERDEVRRMISMQNSYTNDSILYHVGSKTAGLDAINKNVTAVLSNMPANFIFTKLKPVIINHSIGRIIWGVGPEGQPPVATGMDIVHFENGKIKSLYVFLDN